MRNYNRRTSSSLSHSWLSQKTAWIIGITIAVILLGIKVFGGSSPTVDSPKGTGDSIVITPMEQSVVYINHNAGSKEALEKQGNLYTNDSSLMVENGGAKGVFDGGILDIDKDTEIKYKTQAESSNKSHTIKLEKGRVWTESSSNTTFIELNNFTAKIPSGGIAMLEQTNIINSVAYAIKGDIEIITEIGQHTLKPGEKILLSPSDIKSSTTKLGELVGPIDSTVVNTELFSRNNGESIMKQAMSEKTNTEELSSSGSTIESLTGTTTSSTGSALPETNSGAIETHKKYIQFASPTDGATIKTNTVALNGSILSSDVSRVTINDQEAIVSPVNQTFSMKKFELVSGTNNLVYKVYGAGGTELERGVLVVYGPKSASQANTIIPENFPDLKNFVITAPSANPYKTVNSYVKVEGTIPKGTVKYITVNNYRLQKFVPYSTKWYYHANASIGTIKEGTNLYHIKFFDTNDKLIHTQVFTIIKEKPEAIQPTTPTQTKPATATPSTKPTSKPKTNDEFPLFPA